MSCDVSNSRFEQDKVELSSQYNNSTANPIKINDQQTNGNYKFEDDGYQNIAKLCIYNTNRVGKAFLCLRRSGKSYVVLSFDRKTLLYLYSDT